MQPPADPPVLWFFLVVAAMALTGLVGLYWTVSAIVHQSHKLVETNRVLALGYANPDAALRLTQQQTSQANTKRDAVLNQIKLAQTKNARTRAQQEVAGRGKPPGRAAPSLKYHSAVDDDIVPPGEPEEKK